MEKGLRAVHGVVGRVAEPDRSVPRPAFTLKDFQLTDEIEEWIAIGCQSTLILVGPAGSGKTQFVYALAAKFGMKVHVVNNVQGLKDLRPFHNVIAYDNFSGQDLDMDGWLAVLETEQPRQIRVLRDYIRKPGGIIQIMTLNKESFRNISYMLRLDQYSRRCRIAPVKKGFLQPVTVNQTTVNINVQNNHNRIYNNPEGMRKNRENIRYIEGADW